MNFPFKNGIILQLLGELTMSMSTSDCKKFLVDKFPETKSTLWKRVTKYKNAEGLYVRVFQYNDDKMIGLVENGNTLAIVKDDETLERKNSSSINYHVTEEDRNEFSNGWNRNANSSDRQHESSGNDFNSWGSNFNIPVRDPNEQESLTGQHDPRAKKFIFSVLKEGMDICDLGSAVFVAIVEYDFWLEEGGLNGDDASDEPADYMPPEWQAEDVNGCGSWLVYTNLTPDQVEAKLKSIGFTWTQEFDDYMKNR